MGVDRDQVLVGQLLLGFPYRFAQRQMPGVLARSGFPAVAASGCLIVDLKVDVVELIHLFNHLPDKGNLPFGDGRIVQLHELTHF